MPSFGPISSAPISALPGATGNIISQGVTALCNTAVTVAKRTGKFISASADTTVVVSKALKHVVIATCQTAVSIIKRAGKPLSIIAVTTSVSVARAVAKTILVLAPITVIITNTKAFLVTITAFVQTVVSIFAGRYRTPAERIVYVPFTSRVYVPPFHSRTVEPLASDRVVTPYFVTRVVILPWGLGLSRGRSIT